MKRQLLGAAAVIALALGFSAAAEAKTFVYCSEGSPNTFNPQLDTSGTTFDASSIALYNRLIDTKAGTTEVEPNLAESWTVSDDGLVYTLKLRQGVKFHTTKNFKPTRDFNAEDVVFSIERQWKKDNPYHTVSGGAYAYFEDVGFPTLLKSVSAVDDYTVKFELNEPSAPFINVLTLDSFSILSKEYADKMLAAGTPEKVDTDPVGTGPFIFVNYEKDQTIRYKANKDYWRGAPKIDNLVFAITTDPATRLAKIQKGECNFTVYLNPADIPTARADEKLKLYQQEGFNVGYIALNVEKKPFDDKRVRQALNYAINKQAIIDAVYQNAGKVAKNPIPPSLWSYNDAVPGYAYNPEKAKQLLSDAGVDEGTEVELWTLPVSRPYNPGGQKMGELIQQDLAKVGLKAKLVTFEWGEYRKRAREKEGSMVMIGWTGDYGDPDNFMGTLASCGAVGGNNYAQWCYKPFDDLITKARTVTDQAERKKLYEEAQVIFYEEAPWIVLAHSIVTEVGTKNVSGYIQEPTGSHDFSNVDLN